MTTEKEQLEAEIAERDARIVELEASKAAADDMFRSLGGEIYELNAKLSALQAHQPASGGAYSSDPLACLGCAAGCFRCRSSAGVVIGALVSALEGIVHDERVPNEVSQDYAALLIEARRLNHCRAQSVPDDEELKLLRAFYKCCASITDQLADSPKSALARLVEAVKDAAPSTQKKESGDE